MLRYGLFYGAANDGLIEPVRKRQYPIVGDGAGITSFIHLDDAAAATVLALEHDGPGIFNIVDDEPAPVREWLPVYAEALGAGPPRRFPRWLARLFAGEAAVVTGTEARGASNAKAKRELGWQPRYASWREGFAAAYATTAAAERRKPQRAAGGGCPSPAERSYEMTPQAQTRPRPRRLRHLRRAQRAGPRRRALEPGAPAAPDGRASTSRSTPTRSWPSARARCG